MVIRAWGKPDLTTLGEGARVRFALLEGGIDDGAAF